jgi:hypothetical protein
MRWGSERYVKLYKRDTAEWLAVSWQARGLFYELLRKADRTGRIALGRLSPAKALGVLLRADPGSLEPAIRELLEDGCLVHEDGALLLRNYEEAQETPQTPAARKRNERESFDMSRTVTPSHEVSLPDQTRPAQTNPTAAAAPARILPVGTHIQGQNPLLYDLVGRVDFGIALGRSAQPWGQAEALLGQLGTPAAVSALNEAAPNSDGYPGAVPIRFVLKVLADAARQGRKAAPPKPSLPEPDEAWLASLGPRRGEAERRWAVSRDAVLRTVWPDKHAEFLAHAIEQLKAEMVEEAA